MPSLSTRLSPALPLIAIACLGAASEACMPYPENEPFAARESSMPAWIEAEARTLRHHVQLTFPDRFYKAGEPYFSPEGDRLIFQAIEPLASGEEPPEIFSMYVADVMQDSVGQIDGIDNVRCISPPGSANTCGWFDPHDRQIVYFASTLTPPATMPQGGYDRKTGKYVWAKPAEMRIFRCDLRRPAGSAQSLELIAGDTNAYQAEGALSPDGRHIVYCSLETGDGDLYIKDLQTGRTVCVVQKPGYDGGPFFSPDGRRICYRSDRRGNSLLQLFVADLAFDENGSVIGIEREHQLTDNPHVNFGPYWHCDGRHLVYATTELGFRNFEVFIIDADPGDLPGSAGPLKYGTRKRRVTFAAGADVLPTLSHDGRRMVWTSQRGESGRSQLWAADFIIELDPEPQMGRGHHGGHPSGSHADPPSGPSSRAGHGHPSGDS
jgi:TolB protein